MRPALRRLGGGGGLWKELGGSGSLPDPVLAGEAAALDAEAVCQHVFSRVPAEHFHSPVLAFEFVQFCRDSLPLLGRNLSLLRRSFPGLLKARAGRGGVSQAPLS